MRPALRREVSPMGRLFSRRKYRDLMLGLALLCAVLALMRWPQESMAAARDGLALCGNVIIPSLFPSLSSPPWW